MKTIITIICENSVSPTSNLTAEHGISFLVENEDTTLFDTGQGIGIISNMKVLGKDIGKIRRIFLSHGHYDHTGGLYDVLKNSPGKIPVYLHKNAFNSKYARIKNNNSVSEKNIGVPKSQAEYEKAGADFHFINGYASITDKISAICEVKRPYEWKSWDTRLKHEVDGQITDDPFLDDLSLMIETESGPVVLFGCAHSGTIEILHDISSHSGHKEFHAVIGGTHLINAPEEYINNTIDTLKDYKVKIISPAHCSGYEVEFRFAGIFKNEFRKAAVGIVFEF